MIKEAQQLGGEVEFCRWDVYRKDLILVLNYIHGTILDLCKILSEFMVYAYAVLEQWFVRLEEYKL